MDQRDDLHELAREAQLRAPEDAAELLMAEAPDRVQECLACMPPAFAKRVAEHLPAAVQAAPDADEKEPETVADLMEPVGAVIVSGRTVAEAIEVIRHAANPTAITYLYVADADGRLVGLVVMRDLLLARPDQTVDTVMLRKPFALRAEESVDEADKAAIHRQYPVYPVVDAAGRLVGQIHGWLLFERRVIEIASQTGSMVGVSKEEQPDTSVWRAFRMRHPWLQINLLTAFLAALVVGQFEGTITQIVVLAAFLPVLAGQSGNTGCQALAITLRGLILGQLNTYPVRRLIVKEIALGALNGLFTGIVAAIAIYLSSGADDPRAPMLALVICLAMMGACIAAGLFGVLVPLVLKRFGADPATASAIFLTTGTDIAGMGLMLALATVLVL